jgi:hypothetical protein
MERKGRKRDVFDFLHLMIAAGSLVSAASSLLILDFSSLSPSGEVQVIVLHPKSQGNGYQ